MRQFSGLFILLFICICSSSFAINEDEGFVSYWTFDEGSGDKINDSKGKNNGTLYGPTWVDGIKGKALMFDGVDDYIDCGNDESLNLTGEMTISAWMKPTVDIQREQAIVAKGRHDHFTTFTIEIRDGKIYSDGPNKEGQHKGIFGGTSISSGEWYHIAISRDSSGSRVYLNGRLDQTAEIIGGPPGGIHLQIGARNNNYCFQGIIDEVAIYKRALKAEEILEDYNAVKSRIDEQRKAGASKRNGVIFYTSFDKGPDADYSLGNSKAVVEKGELKFEHGKKGEALFSGDETGYVSYEVSGNLKSEQGTIEFWLKPVDWNMDDTRVHSFIATFPEVSLKGGLGIHKIGENPHRNTKNQILFGLSTVGYGGPTITGYDKSQAQFKKGEWYHIVAVWHPLTMQLYVNGESCGVVPRGGENMPEIPGYFSVGDRAYGEEKRSAHSLIDEFYIYGYPFNEEEALWSYEHAIDRRSGYGIDNIGSPLLGVIATPDGYKKKVNVEVFVNPNRLEQFGGNASLDPSVETTPAPLKVTSFGKGEASISFAELPKGKYEAIVTVEDSKGSVVGTAKDVFTAPGPPIWQGNKIGISDIPPPPWTPVQGTKDVIECWGRKYKLGDMGLPSRIESLGKEIMARPIELLISYKGKILKWQEIERSLVNVSKTKIEVQGKTKSEIGTLAWHLTGEYDGMLRYDINLSPSKEISIDELQFRFPLKGENATLYYLNPFSRGAVKPGLKTSWVDGIWWVGNEELGLTGFCESDKVVDDTNRSDIFRIEHSGDSTDVVWSLIAKTKKIDSWQFTFGLQATPVKEKSKNWRYYYREQWYEKPWTKGIYASEHIGCCFGSIAMAPTPQALEEHWKWWKEHKDNGRMVIPYISPTWASINTPEWNFYKSRWRGGHVDKTYGTAQVVFTRDYIDFALWDLQYWFTKLKLDGLYIDFGFADPICNMESGSGYMRDGQQRGIMPFFSAREFYQRLYTMVKETNPENIIIGHISPRFQVPIAAYFDIYLDGERNWKGGTDVTKDSTLDFISLDEFRAEFMGHQFGIIPWFLPWFDWAKLTPEQKSTIKMYDGFYSPPTKEICHRLLGIALLLDFNVWARGGINSEAFEEMINVLDEFEYHDADFSGYWKNSDLIGGQSDAIKASVYRKPQGGALIVVLNTSRQVQTPTLTVDWAKFQKEQPLSVIDAYTKEPVKVEGKNITVEVPVLNYRLLWVK